MNTATISINGATREIEFPFTFSGGFVSHRDFACRIGNGQKLHACEMYAWKFDSVETAIKRGYSTNMIFTFGDQVVAVSLKTMVRNRDARIVAFRDEAKSSQSATQQNYYGSI